MDTIPLIEAKEHLEDLIARAARGEDVRIADPVHGTARLIVEPVGETVAPVKRVPGRWKGKLGPLPDDLFAPMNEEELKDWYGEDALSYCLIRMPSRGGSNAMHGSRPARSMRYLRRRYQIAALGAPVIW
jgi:antitoxin (DNA-binding transcriptional repressor) of toxin-antitoxin stability system